MWDPRTATFFLRNSNTHRPPDIVDQLRRRRLRAQSWATGTATASTRSGCGTRATATFYLRNSNTPGGADIIVNYGDAGPRAVVGDWNGDGVDTLGVWDDHSATFYLRNSNTPGRPDIRRRYGSPGDRPSPATSAASDIDGLGVITAEVAGPSGPHSGVVLAQHERRRADVSAAFGTSGYSFVAG